ncbi:hypothetical protein HDU79_011591 [Rhizoclosmatium sp. JEL0117]|nr:hypothetical protein HDU79_011591 [Rhizoclosmatium sp. JEL0117]
MSTFLTRKGTAKEGTKDVDPQPVPVPQPPQPLPGVKEKLMALTIDDSPSQHTSEILDVLKQHNAKATFFIIGTHVDSTPNGRQLLQRMIAEGHELGNHTMYDRPTISLTHEVFEDELITVDKLLQEYQPSTPRRVKWFRPGSGVFSQDMIDTAEKHGYTTVLGCRFPVDTTSRDPRLNAWHVSAGVHPGAVVVLHDGRAWTAETLRVLAPIVAGKGFRFVNAGELLKVAGGSECSGGGGGNGSGVSGVGNDGKERVGGNESGLVGEVGAVNMTVVVPDGIVNGEVMACQHVTRSQEDDGNRESDRALELENPWAKI